MRDHVVVARGVTASYSPWTKTQRGVIDLRIDADLLDDCAPSLRVPTLKVFIEPSGYITAARWLYRDQGNKPHFHMDADLSNLSETSMQLIAAWHSLAKRSLETRQEPSSDYNKKA